MPSVFVRRRLLAAATLGALAALGGGALYLRPLSASNPPAAAQPAAVPVGVATVEETNVTLWDEFSGRLEAVQRVELRSRVAGAVKSVHFTEGALVKVPKSKIEERRSGKSAMPGDLIKHLSRKDVRDLVEFLASLKEAPKK